MTQLVLTDVGGRPDEIVAIMRTPDLSLRGGEALVAIEAAPINPSDLAFEQGRFAIEPHPPQPLGAAGVGRVLDTGPGTDPTLVGRRVLILPSFVEGTWGDQVVISARNVVPVSERGDALQLAMLPCNSAAAWALLHDYGSLAPGDWVGVTLANSAVGQALVILARRAGIKTLAVVRRDRAAGRLRALGADVVVLDGDDVGARVSDALGDARLRLLLDGGAPALRELAVLVVDGGDVVTFASITGKAPILPLADLQRGVSLHAYFVLRWIRETPRAELVRIYSQLAELVEQGALEIAVEATYPLEQYRDAIAHAARSRRSGKVLFTPGKRSGNPFVLAAR